MNPAQRGDDEGSNGGEGTGKSERKRQREKDRRKEMAEGFVELGHLLAQVDPDDDSSRGKRSRRNSEDAGSADADASGMTRIDLISRAIDTIRRLHNENLELKRRKGGGDEKVCFNHRSRRLLFRKRFLSNASFLLYRRSL